MQGTATDATASLNYTIQNYANDVVAALQDVCLERGIAAPTIISESGRALASHHSVLIFDVLGQCVDTPVCVYHVLCLECLLLGSV